MARKTVKRLTPLLAGGLLIVAAACGGGDGNGPKSSLFQKASPDTQATVESQSGTVVPRIPGNNSRPGGSDVPVPAVPGARAAAGGSCEIKVSGDVSQTYTGKGGPGATGSDYWLTDDEIRQALRQIAGITGKLSGTELDREVDKRLKDDPRLYLLIINCEGQSGDGKASVSLMPAGDSKYADVPFRPKKYTIAAGGLLSSDARPGEFTVLFSVGEGVYRIPEPGELSITRFDKSGIAGSFRFNAEEVFADGTPKKLTIEGKFDYPCSGGSNCRR